MSKFIEKIKSFGLEIKIIAAGIIGFLSFILYFFIKQKIKAKQHLEYELSKIESEKELVKLEGDANVKKEKLNNLKEKESEIRKKISIIEKAEKEQNRDIGLEELDDFFDSRGF